MRKRLLIALFTIGTLAAGAQVDADSLRRLLDTVSTDRSRVSLLDRRSQAATHQAPDRRRQAASMEPAAIEQYRQAIALAKAAGDRSLTSRLYRDLAATYAAAGRHRDAYELQRAHAELQDSLAGGEKARQLADLEVRYARERQSLEIARLERESARKDLHLSEQQRLRNAVIGGGLFLLLIGGVLFGLFHYRRQCQVAHLERERSEDLRRINQLKTQFLANTSHELRTPLQGIIGLAEGLLERIETPQHRKHLSLIVASGHRLNNMVSDILDFSRLRHADIELQRTAVDLHALTELVQDLCRPLATGKTLRLINSVPEDLPPVDGDENRLQQILFNLVGNAIKFTERGHVKVSARPDSDEHIRIWVEDTGIGIPNDKQQLIFEPFEQVDGSTSRHHAGSGLGLSIARKLVELHGGQLWVHSANGLGSIFYFTLPIAAGQAAGPPAIRPQAAPVANRQLLAAEPAVEPPACGRDHVHILIADDDPVNLEVLKSHLAGGPYHLITAADGEEALRIVESGQPVDLALLDVMMPRLSGYEVSQRIRRRHPATELPIIMITAKTRVAELVRGFRSGANDYLAKPFSRDELLARVNTQLHLQQIGRASSKFVPREFLRHLGKEDITEVRLGDQVRREVTVLFTDIRGYTTLAENMTPEENFRFIIAFDELMGPVIQENNGFVNQYLGDGIMAIFPHTPDDALRAAIAMQRRLREHNRRRRTKGRPPIRAGAGLHTGSLIMGIIGDRHRMDAATISDAVNTAARVESLSKHFGGAILLSEDSLTRLAHPDHYHFRSLGLVQVAGKRRPIRIYECFDGDAPAAIRKKEENRQRFDQGMKAYLDGNFAQAHAHFTEVLRNHPEDRAARLFLDSANDLRQDGIPAGWAGIIAMQQK